MRDWNETGNTAGARSLILALVCILAGALALGVPPASALTFRHRLYETAPISQAGAFKSPTGVAVDQETGNVYVADAPSGAVDIFGAEGGSPADGVPAQIAGVEFGSSTSAALAVDNSCYFQHLTASACESFDPANGDVYVGESGKEAIAKYQLNRLSDEYELAATLKVSGEPDSVAVNTEGYVFAGFDGESIVEFSPSGVKVGKLVPEVRREENGEVNFYQYSHNDVAAAGAPGIAYVIYEKEGVARIEFSPSDTVENGEALTDGEGGKAVALDAQGDAYVDTGSGFLEYGPSGAPIEAFSGSFSGSEGIAVAAATGDVYVSNGSAGNIVVYGPAEVAPIATTGSAREVRQHSAVLGGTVDPEGTSVTECYFEYGTTGPHGQSAPCVPAPGSGRAPVEVSAEVQGLQGEGATYYYRLVVVTRNGVVGGGQATFTTAGPRIDGESVTGLAVTSATLNALIDPFGEEAKYHFEYDTTSYRSGAPHGTSIPAPEGDAGAGSVDVLVSARAQGLSPETTYHYRVLASNPHGETVIGHEGTFTTPPPSCPNEALRTGFNMPLPECRAYELVTPPGTPPSIQEGYSPSYLTDESNVFPDGMPEGVNLTVGGERIAYESEHAPVVSAYDSEYYMASRGPRGWSTVSLVPPQSAEYNLGCYNAYAVAFSAELTSWVLGDGWAQPGNGESGGEDCGKDDPELVPDEPQGFQNLFVSEGLNAPYQLIDVTPEGVQPADAVFQAASGNLEHVVFDERARLTPDAPANPAPPERAYLDLYVWTRGAEPAVRLVSILPSGAVATDGALVNRAAGEGLERAYGAGSEIYTHAVSNDGKRVFFYAEGGLYARENAYAEQGATGACTEAEQKAEPEKACTVQIDASQNGGKGGEGTFMWASADGARVFFTDTKRLTADATAAAGKPDLYEYNFEAPEGSRLTDLTVNAVNASEPADVLGVSGVSEDGSYVYFVADGALTSEANSNGDTAVPGEPNLYVAHGGKVDLIATLASTYDRSDWEPGPRTARVSENGRYIAFNSQGELTGYDNTPIKPGDCTYENSPRPCTEIFLYDAQEKQLSCVSCEPNGAPPTRPTLIPHSISRLMDDDRLSSGGPEAPSLLQHIVTDDGQVFFDTSEPLLPRATNGQVNVYEYRDGDLQLLSTATGAEGAYFYEATPSGGDVFITANQALAPGAEGSEYAIYDVRVDGGFAEEKAKVCGEEECRGPLTPTPLLGAPSSQTLVAAGNPIHTPAPKIEKHKKNKKKHQTKGKGKKRKGKKARHARRSARRNRGGAR